MIEPLLHCKTKAMQLSVFYCTVHTVYTVWSISSVKNVEATLITEIKIVLVFQHKNHQVAIC